jgi:predicted nucleotidyltransferase
MGQLHEGYGRLTAAMAAVAPTVLGEEVVAVAVFGSVGRGTPRFDSDCDVLLILRHAPRSRSERASIGEQIEVRLDPLLTELASSGIDASFSWVVRSVEELREGFPLLLDMVDDGRILFDPERVLADRLADLRTRLDASGARRIWRANTWHWDVRRGTFVP